MDKNYPFTFGDATPKPVAGHHLLKSPPAAFAPAASGIHMFKYRVLGTLSLVGISYMATVGGPVGSETLISTGGPLIGLLSIAAYFLLCMIPIALMVTELCCAFPENGGFATWTMAAFGPFWGFQVGYWAWIVSVINNAIYPEMIYETMTLAFGVVSTSSLVAYLIKVTIALLLALPSYLGSRFIGVASLVMLSLVVLTTVVFTVWGFANGESAFARLRETRTLDGSSPIGDNVDWPMMVRWLFMSFDGIQWISMIGGEVRNPARTYPRVIFFTLSLVVVLYLAPFIVAVVGNKTPWRKMVKDSYPVVAAALGGPGLESVVLFTSIVSAVGLFANSVFLQSFLIQGMAEAQLLPDLFRQRSSRFKTPKYALLASFAATMVVMSLRLDTLLTMSNAFSAAVQVMVVLAMLQLRRALPNLHRPMRVSGNLMTLALMLLPALGVFLFVIGYTFTNWNVGVPAIACAIFGMIFSMIRNKLAGLRMSV